MHLSADQVSWIVHHRVMDSPQLLRFTSHPASLFTCPPASQLCIKTVQCCLRSTPQLRPAADLCGRRLDHSGPISTFIHRSYLNKSWTHSITVVLIAPR